jgi:uncharacterized membrane protein
MIARSRGAAHHSRTYDSPDKVRARLVPAVYAVAAIAVGLTLPRAESQIFPRLVTPISVGEATAVYSAIASGMIAMTGIVFSLALVMVQFSASAYSPRLVLWIARDPVMSHALRVFTATFLYAIAALTGLDRNGSGHVPVISFWLVVALLLASVAMFISLIQLIGLLQVNQMLIFTGDRGREVIATIYPLDKSEVEATQSVDSSGLTCTQTLIHHGRPRSIQAVNMTALVNLAAGSGGIIEMTVAVGDTVVEMMPVLRVFRARRPIDERKLWDGIEIGDERTFEQDPKYAIRLLVDIAIRALSPAINDPTTAVQALDQIEDLLTRLGQRHLEIGEYRDNKGDLRLVVPFPAWEDLVRLSFDEICFCGANSVQVMRRMNALIGDLIRVPEARRPTIRHWQTRVRATIARSFAGEEERMEALEEDRQGLGVPRQGSQSRLGD